MIGDRHPRAVRAARRATRPASDSEYLASSRTAEVLDRLTQGAPQPHGDLRFAARARRLAGRRAGQARRPGAGDRAAPTRPGSSALEDALSLLSACPDIKLLLNAANFSPSGRRFGTYYGYGG